MPSSAARTGWLWVSPERLYEHDFQFVVMDPEGDNKGLGNAGAIGSANDAPRADEVLDSSPKAAGFAAMSMLDVRTEDRAGYLAGLRPERLAHREWTGRPYFVGLTRCIACCPRSWDPGDTALSSGLRGFHGRCYSA